MAEPRGLRRGQERRPTPVNGGYTLTLYRRPVNPGWGQVVVMPNPMDSWVMGWPSLVPGWSIICLIKQERHRIIELLTDLVGSHSSSASGQAGLNKNQLQVIDCRTAPPVIPVERFGNNKKNI